MNYLATGLCALALTLGLTLTAQANTQPLPQIHATGEAEVALAPDMASLQLTVAREADTARAALDANSAAMAQKQQQD